MIPRGSEHPARHDFLHVDCDRLAREWALAPAADQAFALDWFACARPAIAARGDARIPDAVAAGIATPPAQGKRRIALQLPRSAVSRIVPPPSLRSVAEQVDAHQQELIELVEAADAEGIRFRVFGSFAWQHLTGLPYVSVTSDLDLLWRPVDEHQLSAGIDLLSRWERGAGLRVDGEIEFAQGDAVSWREWANGRPEVLVKHLCGVRMAPRARVEITRPVA